MEHGAPRISWFRPGPSKGSGNVCLTSCLLLACVCLFIYLFGGYLMNEGIPPAKIRIPMAQLLSGPQHTNYISKEFFAVVIADKKKSETT